MSFAMRLLAAALLLPALGACTSTTPHLDAGFGESVATLRAQQTADLSASLRNQDRVVLGFEARTAGAAIDRYYGSFAKPAKPANIFTIGIGAGPAAP